jgi:HSP90 family molecular chaperone
MPEFNLRQAPPNPERTKDAIARIGYSLEESIADLIDNSLDAQATDVLIRFIYDRKNIHRIFVVDNGHGMREETLRRAMQFGSTLRHEKTDLGKYGIGLKSASLSQCNQFSVISRVDKEVSGRRWSSDQPRSKSCPQQGQDRRHDLHQSTAGLISL